MMKKNRHPFFSQSLTRIFLVVTFLISSTGWAQDSKTESRYLKDLEKLRKGVKLMPIKLDKTEYSADDVFKPVAVFRNTTTVDLVIPLLPGVAVSESTNNIPYALCSWQLHRKDNKDVFIDRAFNKSDTMSFVPILTVDGSMIKTGGDSQIPFPWKDTIKKLNLAPGQYELILETYPVPIRSSLSPTFSKKISEVSDGNLRASQKVIFSVENPDYKKMATGDAKKDTESVLRKNEPIIRKMISTLKVSELTISNTEVKKGTDFSAKCYLENPTKENLVYSTSNRLSFCYQWWIKKLTGVKGNMKQVAQPDGGGIFHPVIFENRVRNEDQDITITPGLSYEIKETKRTDDLDPGLYELSVDITFGDKKIKTSSVKFKVIE